VGSQSDGDERYPSHQHRYFPTDGDSVVPQLQDGEQTAAVFDYAKLQNFQVLPQQSQHSCLILQAAVLDVVEIGNMSD
jgi:hypothetical protein